MKGAVEAKIMDFPDYWEAETEPDNLVSVVAQQQRQNMTMWIAMGSFTRDSGFPNWGTSEGGVCQFTLPSVWIVGKAEVKMIISLSS